MIKKLRIRFALSVILSSLLILAVLIGTINIVNYRRVVADADRELEMLIHEHPGDMPSRGRPEMNSFSALYDEDGNAVNIVTTWNSMYAADLMDQYAQSVLEGSQERGFIDDLRFAKIEREEGTLVVLCDCGPGLRGFRSFLYSSIILSAVCMAVVSVLALVVSGRAVKPVAESYEKQKQFITDAGHEIKTPLAIINADSDVLLSELGDNEWVQDIKVQTKRLSVLTNDLIRLSKMDQGKQTLKLAKVNLTEVVSEEVNSFRAVAAQGGRSLKMDADPDVNVMGDAQALRELVSILLDNAVKYSPEGSRIDISLNNENKTAVLNVRNNTAEPVSDEVLDKLFDRFYRADPSRESGEGGYGIGLSLARAAAEAHSGSITVHKEGADVIVFTVVLPLAH